MIELQSYQVLQNHTESSIFLDTCFPANFQLPFWKKKASQTQTKPPVTQLASANQGRCTEGGEDGGVVHRQLALVTNKVSMLINSVSFNASMVELTA